MSLYHSLVRRARAIDLAALRREPDFCNAFESVNELSNLCRVAACITRALSEGNVPGASPPNFSSLADPMPSVMLVQQLTLPTQQTWISGTGGREPIKLPGIEFRRRVAERLQSEQGTVEIQQYRAVSWRAVRQENWWRSGLPLRSCFRPINWGFPEYLPDVAGKNSRRDIEQTAGRVAGDKAQLFAL